MNRIIPIKMSTVYEQEFDTIPSLHRTYANLGGNGEWVYWEQTADSRWKWNPKWVTYTHTMLQTILKELEAEWMNLLREEDDTPEKDKTDEWYQTFTGRKLSLDTEIVYYQQMMRLNNNH